jgi:hypothetical protein
MDKLLKEGDHHNEKEVRRSFSFFKGRLRERILIF